MNAVDKKRKEVEVLRLRAALAEGEMKIMEREDEIERIHKTMSEQRARIEEIENQKD